MTELRNEQASTLENGDTLAKLAEEANREYAAAQKAMSTGVERALACGRSLVKAKTFVPHGRWLTWVDDNFDGRERTARAYMRLASHWRELEGKTAETADLTIDSALKLLAAPAKEPLDTDVRHWQRSNSEFGLPDDLDDRPHRGILVQDGTVAVAVELVPSTKFPGYIYAAIVTKDVMSHHSRPVRSNYLGWLLDFILREDCGVDVRMLTWGKGSFERSILFDLWFEDFDPATATGWERQMAQEMQDMGYVA